MFDCINTQDTTLAMPILGSTPSPGFQDPYNCNVWNRSQNTPLDKAMINMYWKSHLFANFCWHYIDVIMTTMASQITSPTVVYSTVYSDADQRKHQSSASLAFVRGIHRRPVNSPHKRPATRKCFHLMMTSSCFLDLLPAAMKVCHVISLDESGVNHKGRCPLVRKFVLITGTCFFFTDNVTIISSKLWISLSVVIYLPMVANYMMNIYNGSLCGNVKKMHIFLLGYIFFPVAVR